MPRVSRNYERTDFSDLLAKMHSAATDENTAQVPVTVSAPEEVSEARRRRSSLMDKREMKYAFSRADGILHDRDCPLVKRIEDSDFAMQSEFSQDKTLCRRCYRKAMIRSAVHLDDTKKIDAYLSFFNRIHASNDALFELLIENDAKLSDIQLDSVTVRVNEDRWMIRMIDQDRLHLLHNDYETEDNTRYFDKAYHLQKDGSIYSFRHFVFLMCHYSWEEHKAAKEKAEAAKVLHKQQNDLRNRLQSVKNCSRVKRLALFHHYYALIDCNGRIRPIANKKGLRLTIMEETTLGEPSSPYKLVVCRVKRTEVKDFLVAVDALKEYSIAAGYSEYADFCLREIRQF